MKLRSAPLDRACHQEFQDVLRSNGGRLAAHVLSSLVGTMYRIDHGVHLLLLRWYGRRNRPDQEAQQS